MTESTTNSPHPPRLAIFGCGYIGSAVARSALQRGWEVTALTRNPAHAEALRAASINTVVADLVETGWHERMPRAVDYVLHCVSSGGAGLPGYRHSYVEGTKSLVAWARAGCAATIVYTSSTSVYPQRAGEIVTETSATGGGSEAAAPLLEAERLVHESGCFARWFILRLAGIYGPGRHYLLDQLRAGATVFPGTGAHRLNLAHRDDIVAAVQACFDAPPAVRDLVFNVADDTAAPKGEVVAWLAAQLGRNVPQFARDEEKPSPGAAVVRGRSGPVPDRVISNARLKAALGWRAQFPDFREGYRQIFAVEGKTAGRRELAQDG